ncbi:SDR family NAD(P)-dependent oxidoreductase [Metabacillus herbersteinensis]|uniref:SDR family NAD(P)-dependent oxidoreductase n=1 Tax=Metabacillus herbersteinensis TaxID=283816 RepID=A0ABV6GAG6_9BACI
MRFQSKIAVITGAGSGIGEATAHKLASEGAKVILVGRSLEKLEKVAAAINENCSNEVAFPFSADVTKEGDVINLASYVRETHGDLHVLVNNAGGSVKSQIFETTLEQWDYVQDVNLKSVFLVSKLLGEVMKERVDAQSRAIVNVASLSGHKAGAQIPHYSSAKAGVINFSRALALELAPSGVRVNSVSPGFVETPLTEKGLENESFVKAIERNTALNRVGRPEEIASVIAFAASEDASYMTGSDLLIDGGWLIK